MSDYKTLRVPEDAWEEAKAEKEANDRTWGEQLLHEESNNGPEIVIQNVEVKTKESGVNSDDVEGIVENWVENNYEDLRRGNL